MRSMFQNESLNEIKIKFTDMKEQANKSIEGIENILTQVNFVIIYF